MDFVIIRKENDMAILRGINTGTYYMAANLCDGWYVGRKKELDRDWITFPKVKLEPDVVKKLGLPG